MHNEISNVGRAPIFKGINHRAVSEICAIGILELQRNHTRRVAAQKPLTFRSKFPAHITCQRALASAQRGLIESHIALSAHESKLHRIQNRGLSNAVNADEICCAVAINGNIFKQMPVDETDAGEEFH